MKKIKILRPDMIIAMSAALVGISALFVSIYEADLFRKQQKATVWPYLELSFSSSDHFSYNIENKGVGPAIVKWVKVVRNGELFSHWSDYARYIQFSDSVQIVTSYINSRVISAGEKIQLIYTEDPEAIRCLAKAERKNPLYFYVCYASIFGDHWIVKRDSTGTGTKPVKLQMIPVEDSFQN
ncbi:hypothetical protein KAR48_01115 [bacterium]|nr:hypothetical protein [bacterium]